jgi:hypothetical protein
MSEVEKVRTKGLGATIVRRRSSTPPISRSELDNAMERYFKAGGKVSLLKTKSDGSSLSKAFPENYHGGVYGDGDDSEFSELG